MQDHVSYITPATSILIPCPRCFFIPCLLFIYCSLILRSVIPGKAFNFFPRRAWVCPHNWKLLWSMTNRWSSWHPYLLLTWNTISCVYLCSKPICFPSPVLFPSFPLNSVEMFCFRAGLGLPCCWKPKQML